MNGIRYAVFIIYITYIHNQCIDSFWSWGQIICDNRDKKRKDNTRSLQLNLGTVLD